MQPEIDVVFRGSSPDRALEAVVRRWVARLEATGLVLRFAFAVIERSGRHETSVLVAVALASGDMAHGEATHIDPYVAVSDAFRMVRLATLRRPPAVQHVRASAG